jgi:hypothetical protein
MNPLAPSNEESKLFLGVLFGVLVAMPGAYAWYVTYPLHHPSLLLPTFNAIDPVYWVFYALCVLLFCWYALRVNKLKIAAALGFFTLTRSLSLFSFSIPGPDPFFENLGALYFKSGFVDPEFARRYAWPGFFLLIRVFSEVSGLPGGLLTVIFFLGVGSLIVFSIFLTAQARQIDAFWAIVACSILAIVALDPQFVPHFLGVAFLTLLLWRETTKELTAGERVLRLMLLAGLAITHAYLGFFYVGYLLVRSLFDRTSVPRVVLAFLLVSCSNVFLASAALRTNVLIVLTSIPALLGLSEYNARMAETLVTSSPFQPFSRVSVLAAAFVCATGLVVMIRRRILTRREHALLVSGAMFAAIGAVVTLIGLQSLQLDLLPAALGAGYLPLVISSRRMRALMLIILALSSIFPVMHLYYDPRIQTQDDVAAAAFVSSKLDTTAQYGLYPSYMLRGYFMFLWPAYEYDSRVTAGGSVQDFIANSGSEADYIFLSYNVPILQLEVGSRDYLVGRANVVLNYGSGELYYWAK